MSSSEADDSSSEEDEMFKCDIMKAFVDRGIMRDPEAKNTADAAAAADAEEEPLVNFVFDDDDTRDGVSTPSTVEPDFDDEYNIIDTPPEWATEKLEKLTLSGEESSSSDDDDDQPCSSAAVVPSIKRLSSSLMQKLDQFCNDVDDDEEEEAAATEAKRLCVSSSSTTDEDPVESSTQTKIKFIFEHDTFDEYCPRSSPVAPLFSRVRRRLVKEYSDKVHSKSKFAFTICNTPIDARNRELTIADLGFRTFGVIQISIDNPDEPAPNKAIINVFVMTDFRQQNRNKVEIDSTLELSRFLTPDNSKKYYFDGEALDLTKTAKHYELVNEDLIEFRFSMPRRNPEGDLSARLSRERQKHYLAASSASSNRHVTTSHTHSVTVSNDLTDLLEKAEIADVEFENENNFRIVNSLRPMKDKEVSAEDITPEDLAKCCVPRKPDWHMAMQTDEYKKAEQLAIMKWRKGLFELEAKCSLTPFERNIDFWRELWRVLELSDTICQIVDARNPLLFFSRDLMKYACDELNKRHILVLNKADFLSVGQVMFWQSYFNERNIDALFFSSYSNVEIKCGGVVEDAAPKHYYTSSSLLVEIRQRSVLKKNGEMLRIGLVGMPNVGKSSTINALLRIKKVAISANPGRTKHYQTLKVDDNTMLIDCPGLVIPSISKSIAEIVINGVISLHQLRNFFEPASLILSKMPINAVEAVYGVSLNDCSRDDVSYILNVIGFQRGFMTAAGQPDQSRVARLLISDYLNGKLLYCTPPPGVDEVAFESVSRMEALQPPKSHCQNDNAVFQSQVKNKSRLLDEHDEEFFERMASVQLNVKSKKHLKKHKKFY